MNLNQIEALMDKHFGIYFNIIEDETVQISLLNPDGFNHLTQEQIDSLQVVHDAYASVMHTDLNLNEVFEPYMHNVLTEYTLADVEADLTKAIENYDTNGPLVGTVKSRFIEYALNVFRTLPMWND